MKKVLLLGDSIRIGYDKYVKMAFDGVLDVRFPKENCAFSTYNICFLSEWKKRIGFDDHVDLVHFNVGLWDSLEFENGDLFIDIEMYKENIERILNIIKILFPKAKIIFATSTPVIESHFVNYKRKNKNVVKYNKAATEIVKKQGGEINDLYSLVIGVPESYYSDSTHLYTKEGTKILTRQVCRCIEKTLEVKAKKLDYNKLFGEISDIVGI